jgi:hypothetical protein
MFHQHGVMAAGPNDRHHQGQLNGGDKKVVFDASYAPLGGVGSASTPAARMLTERGCSRCYAPRRSAPEGPVNNDAVIVDSLVQGITWGTVETDGVTAVAGVSESGCGR